MPDDVVTSMGGGFPVVVIPARDATALLPAFERALIAAGPEQLAQIAQRLAAVQLDVVTRLAALHGAASDGSSPASTSPRPPSVHPAPTLAALPLITKGPHKGERWMTKLQFAAWCGVSVATVSDWVYTRRVQTTKRGTAKQSRVMIASGERERLRPPVVMRSRKTKGEDDEA